jgi:hypothetical protein
MLKKYFARIYFFGIGDCGLKYDFGYGNKASRLLTFSYVSAKTAVAIFSIVLSDEKKCLEILIIN